MGKHLQKTIKVFNPPGPQGASTLRYWHRRSTGERISSVDERIYAVRGTQCGRPVLGCRRFTSMDDWQEKVLNNNNIKKAFRRSPIDWRESTHCERPDDLRSHVVDSCASLLSASVEWYVDTSTRRSVDQHCYTINTVRTVKAVYITLIDRPSRLDVVWTLLQSHLHSSEIYLRISFWK